MRPDKIVTWSDVLGKDYIGGYRVYAMYDDSDTCLYVGRSSDAHTRLLSHVGRGTFAVSGAGQWIIDHRPQSHEWKIALYFPSAHSSIESDIATDALENKLIYELSPIFNTQGKKRDRGKSRAFWDRQPATIANEGMV